MSATKTALLATQYAEQLAKSARDGARTVKTICDAAFSTSFERNDVKNRSWWLSVQADEAEMFASGVKEMARQAALSASDAEEFAPGSETARDARRYAQDALEASAIASAVARVLRQKATSLA